MTKRSLLTAALLSGIALTGIWAMPGDDPMPNEAPKCDADASCSAPWIDLPLPIPAPPADCQEDEACWDCPTMGNRECGVGTPDWMMDGDPRTGFDAD